VAVDGTAVQTLDDVVFGDVFLFSGQSNIDVPEACQSAAFLSTHRACTHTQKHERLHRRGRALLESVSQSLTCRPLPLALSLINLLSRLFTYSRTRSPTHSLTHLLTHSLTHLLTHTSTHQLIHRSPNALLSSDAHQFNASAQREEEAAADALGGLTRIMIVPNQVRGINYNSTAARELVSVPDQTLCGPAFVGGVYSHCQGNAMRWTRANSTNIRGFSATAWFTGKAIRSRLGAGFANVPIGLVRSSWGGAR